MNRIARLSAVLAAALPTLGLAAEWNIDPAHTVSSFSVKHLVITTVRGQFGKTTGKASIDDADITRSRVEAVIDATTVDTRVPDRDAHLKSADFFDVAHHPTITFRSTKVEKAGDGKLKVTGDLTMRGVTRPVVLDVTGPTPEIKGMGGEIRRAISASTQVNRKDFGLAWNKMIEAGPVVGDEIAIQLDVEMIKGAK